jgi:hypothetical protein
MLKLKAFVLNTVSHISHNVCSYLLTFLYDPVLELFNCLWSIRVLNPLKPNGNYTYQLLQQSETLHFVFMGFI